jgi:ABC-type dipeptide/oligopeptide/nickel transport system permease subunit
MTTKEKASRRSRAATRIAAAWKVVRKRKESVAGLLVVGVFMITALVVEVGNLLHIQVTPYSPLADVGGTFLSPNLSNFFGTDNLGRDVFSRIVSATPYDVTVGYVVVGVSFLVGSILGGYAGLRGGYLDEALMRITDAFFALPVLVLAMVIGSIIGTGVLNMMVVLAIVWWPPYARLARGEALKVAHQNYVEAARLSGQSSRKILFGHVVPNISGTILIYATLDVGTVILTYSGLSYLGLANHPPFPDWGEMVSQYHSYLLSAPWLAIFPGLVISLGVIGFSLLGDGVKEVMEAR